MERKQYAEKTAMKCGTPAICERFVANNTKLCNLHDVKRKIT